MVYAARHRVRIYLVYAEYRVVLVDPIYNCSVSPYDGGYLLWVTLQHHCLGLNAVE